MKESGRENFDYSNRDKKSVKIGYRHIDTAQAYENEESIGIGIKECLIDRKELFIEIDVLQMKKLSVFIEYFIL